MMHIFKESYMQEFLIRIVGARILYIDGSSLESINEKIRSIEYKIDDNKEELEKADELQQQYDILLTQNVSAEETN